MEPGSSMTKQLHDESVWLPQTPGKSTSERLSPKVPLPVGTITSAIKTKQCNSFSPSSSISNQPEKVIRAKIKSVKKYRYRPKVVREGRINKSPKTKSLYPSTPKLRTPKPPKAGTSKRTVDRKCETVIDNTLKASHEDTCLDYSEVLDPSPGLSPDISTKDNNCNINYEVVNSPEEAAALPTKECDDNKLMYLKPEVDSRSCRRALNFDSLVENDQSEHPKDGNASCTARNRRKNSRMLVYHRRSNLEKIHLQNQRKFGPDFPQIFRKDRTGRRTTLTRFITSLLSVWRQNGEITSNYLMDAIAAKDTKLNLVKKLRTARKENVLPTINSEPNCEQASSKEYSHEVLEKDFPPVQVARSSVVNDPKAICIDSVPLLSTMSVRTTNESDPKLYRASLIPTINSEPNREQARSKEDSHEVLEKDFPSVQVARSLAVNDPKVICIDSVPSSSTMSVRTTNESDPKLYCASLIPTINSEPNCEQASSKEDSHEALEKSFPLVQVAQSSADSKTICIDSVPSLSTMSVRRRNESDPKLYRGSLIPYSGPPRKKPRGLEEIIKKIQRLYVSNNIGLPRGPKKKSGSGVGGELVLYQKKQRHMPKVNIDQETEREFNLLLQTFEGGPNERRGDDTEKWWEEERERFRVRMLTFISIMHIIQGDRRFSEWKGSVVDSVVGVFLTQNVSDHLSSSAFMSLASKFPIKRNETEYVNSDSAKTIPIVKEIEPQRDECCRDSNPLERETVLQTEPLSKAKVSDSNKNQGEEIDWDQLRKTYGDGVERDTSDKYLDSVDWEAVRLAPPEEVSNAIQMRGQHVVIGGKIQAFLNRLVRDHGSIDLEWLRNVPPDKAKKYLLSFYGLGLKSVECIRLLSLHHHAFPVDINVSRVAVRLGWVPIQPLPGGLEFHLLDQYPVMDAVQVYLWPRLCTLDQKLLYELHYQTITFGKVLCKKQKPACGLCPMKGDCKHHASEAASYRRSLPGAPAEENSTSSLIVSISPLKGSSRTRATATESVPSSSYKNNNIVEPIIEYPSSPIPVSNEVSIPDIEDWNGQTEDIDYEEESEDKDVGEGVVPSIKLGDDMSNENENDDIPTLPETQRRLRDAMKENNIVISEDDMSKAIVALTSSIPAPELKNIGRLKTIHHAYELPDRHPILNGVPKRERDDPSPYLLVIWASAADAGPSVTEDQNPETVPATLIIPCRTATNGRFPLNGTYFQVNEVFVDDESSKKPVQVPRKWLWNLRRRSLYCGSSASAIFTGCSLQEIQRCFWTGYICVRAFNRKTRAPVDLPKKFHVSTVSNKTKENSKRKYAEGKRGKAKGDTPKDS